MRDFGRIPYDPIEDGALGQITNAAAKVYACLCAHNMQDHGRVNPGMRRIAKLTRLHISTVSDAVQQLESVGLIETPERKNGARITYTIVGTVRTEANGKPSKRSDAGERSPLPSVRVGANGTDADRSDSDARPFGFSPQSVRVGANERIEGESNKKAAAAVVDFLKSIGMAGKLLTDCSALDDLTVEQARAVYDQASRRPNVRHLPGLVGKMLLDGDRGVARSTKRKPEPRQNPKDMEVPAW